jgi:hypothetical protein
MAETAPQANGAESGGRLEGVKVSVVCVTARVFVLIKWKRCITRHDKRVG